MKFFHFSFLLFVLTAFSACTSPQKRIKQNQEVFDRFPREVQQRVATGSIDIGDTRDMVRIAKGEPQYVTIRETQDAEIEVWRWTRTQQYLYSQPVHFLGRGVPSPQIVDITQLREIEILRVEFLDDNVVVIEELREQ
jgi:hypothetical protein